MSTVNYKGLDSEAQKKLLLRVLGVKEEDIEAVSSHTVPLKDVLKKRIDEVQYNPNDTTQCAIVCQNMRLDDVTYDSLDASVYLDHINEMKARGGQFADDVTPGTRTGGYGSGSSSYGQGNGGYSSGSGSYGQGNGGYGSNGSYRSEQSFDSAVHPGATPQGSVLVGIYPSPIKRYLARMVDQAIYLILSTLLIVLLFGVNPGNYSGSNFIVFISFFILQNYLAFIVEPLVVHFTGTTVGKLIFGIKLTAINGDKLSLKTAYRRSLRLLSFGFGFMIPIYHIIRMAICYNICKVGMPLPWDVDVKITFQKKTEPWRVITFIASLFILAFGLFAVTYAFQVPPAKAPLTEAQFYDNCAYVVRYDSMSFTEIPEYTIETAPDGTVKAVTFTKNITDQTNIYGFRNEMLLAFLSFAGVQKGASFISINVDVLPIYFQNVLSDFSFEYAGVRITNDIDYTGYSRNVIYGYLYQNGDGEHIFKQTFRMELK